MPNRRRIRGTPLLTLAVLAAMVLVAGAAHADSFIIVIGPLPGDTNSELWGVSADGLYAVGRSGESSPTGIRYRASDGHWDPLGSTSVARAASFDGTWVVGGAHRWSEATGWLYMGTIPGQSNPNATSWAANSDGSRIVGRAGGGDPFIWDEVNGMVGLSTEGGAARGLVDDGSLIVGYLSSGYSRPVSWTNGGASVDLPPIGFSGEALAVTPDGDVIVGWSSAFALGGDARAVTWTSSGVTQLGIVGPADAELRALDISDDGSVIVGEWFLSSTNKGAVIWIEGSGAMLLEDYLQTEHGLTLPDWDLWSATGVSADGRTIVGSARQPAGFPISGFIAHLAEDFVRGNCNGLGVIDIADAVYLLLRLFDSSATGEPPCVDACDANDDGLVDIADPISILAYLFLSTGPLLPPTEHCWSDATADPLDCETGVCP